jgi:hypothetical protein
MLAASHIPLDPRLPHLATIASEMAMGALFGLLMRRGWKVRRVRIRETRYYPGCTCLLTYHLKCAGPGGAAQSLTLYGRAYGPESMPDGADGLPPLSTAAGPLPRFLPEVGLGLWTFPDDPAVAGLDEVWRRGGALFDQPGVLDLQPWPGARPALETSVVSYVPTKRCILRYDRADHASPAPFFGKVYAVEDAALLYGQMQDLWAYARDHAPELVLARPLGCLPRLNAVWQGSPGGEPFLEAIEAADLPALMRRVAAAMAALHRSPLRPVRQWRLHEETAKLERARAALGRFYPQLRPEVDVVLGDLIERAPAESERLVPVHGDFHCNQVLVQDERVAVIDFDLFGMGDPLHDVGRFLSRFCAFAHGRLSSQQVAAAEKSFLSTYEILVPWAVHRDRLAWIMATLLVNRQVLKSVKKLSAGGAEPVAELLASAARVARGRELG